MAVAAGFKVRVKERAGDKPTVWNFEGGPKHRLVEEPHGMTTIQVLEFAKARDLLNFVEELAEDARNYYDLGQHELKL